MAVKGGADGIDVDAFMRDLVAKAAPKAARQALKDLALQQRKLINTTQRPGGGAQKVNAESTKRRKGGKKPLWDKGILRDNSQWRVRKRESEIVLKPPASRETAVYILRAQGYWTVFDELPDDFNDTLQGRLDEQTTKVKAKVKRRRGKG